MLRWGVLSTALINRKLLRGARQVPEVEIVAVASRERERADRFAAEWAIPQAYGSYDELLASPEVDAVYVPLPNGLHHEWTLRALRAGKHVLCEKPYSSHPAEVVEAFDEADRRGLVLSEAFMFRYNPQIQALRTLVESGAIGDLRLVNASFSWPTDAPGDVRLDPALDGGSLLDVGVYPVSAARLLAGEPVAVTASAARGPTGVDTAFASTMAFAGAVLAHFDCGFHLPDRSRLEVVGTTATIEVSDPWHCYRPGITTTWQDGRSQKHEFQPTDSYALELRHFAAAVETDCSTELLGRDDALGQARAVEMLRSAADHHNQ